MQINKGMSAYQVILQGTWGGRSPGGRRQQLGGRRRPRRRPEQPLAGEGRSERGGRRGPRGRPEQPGGKEGVLEGWTRGVQEAARDRQARATARSRRRAGVGRGTGARLPFLISGCAMTIFPPLNKNNQNAYFA